MRDIGSFHSHEPSAPLEINMGKGEWSLPVSGNNHNLKRIRNGIISIAAYRSLFYIIDISKLSKIPLFLCIKSSIYTCTFQRPKNKTRRSTLPLGVSI